MFLRCQLQLPTLVVASLVLLHSVVVRAVGHLDKPEPDGSARAALAAAIARVQEADAAANSLQDQVRDRVQSSQDGDAVKLVLSKAETLQTTYRRHSSVTQKVKIHNASQAKAKFRSTLRSLSHAIPPLTTVAGDAQSLDCDLRWRPGSVGIAAFMHIGKAAGTAFRRAILNRPMMARDECMLVPVRSVPDIAIHRTKFTVGRVQWRYTKSHKHEYGDGQAWEFHIPELLATRSNGSNAQHRGPCREAVPCLCTAHYDFSLLEALYKAMPHGTVAGLALIRDPVDRFLSHFYHARRLEWTAGLRIRELSPAEFLQDPESMLDALMVWQDGVAGVSWWAGQTVHFGMGATGDLADNLRLQAGIQNRSETLKKAVRNYHRFAFVGILEEMDASLELLQHVLGWQSPPNLERINVADSSRPAIGLAERRKIKVMLRVLAPMDMWFYEYVKADFHLRLNMIRQRQGFIGTLCTMRPVTIDFPSEAELGGCIATRDAIACGRSVFMKQLFGTSKEFQNFSPY